MTALALGAALLPVLAWGQWSRDPQHAIQFDGILAAKLVSDSLGGVFLYATGGDFRGYCYYVDREGYPVWQRWIDTSPLAAYNQTSDHAICPEPGYLITLGYSTWITDEGDTSWDIRAQKINSEGESLWPDSGISISETRLRFDDLASFEVLGVVTTGESGIIIVWRIIYFRENQWGDLIYDRSTQFVQLVSTEGDLLWSANDSLLYFTVHHTIPDGNGGIIVLSSSNNDNDNDIKAQRVSADGEPLWGEHGVLFELDSTDTYIQHAISDGFGGALISLRRYLGGRHIIRVFRIDSEGRLSWGNENGVVIVDVDYRHGADGSRFIQTTDSIFFISWYENAPHPLVQAIDLNGNLHFEGPGLTLCNADRIFRTISGVSSSNSAIYGFFRPTENELEGAFYCQRMDTQGNRLWTDEGVMLFNRRGMNISDVIIDRYGGAIFQIGNLYLQHINHDGELGVPLSIRDFDKPLMVGLLSYSIFPNPANGMTMLKFDTPIKSTASLAIYDQQGRLLTNQTLLAGAESHPLEISMFPSGNYIVQLRFGQISYSQYLGVIK